MLATVPTNVETRELLRQFELCDERYLERVDELPDDLDEMDRCINDEGCLESIAWDRTITFRREGWQQ